MSSSTTASGVVYRRTGARERKQRPASIAGTGMTQEGNAKFIQWETNVHFHDTVLFDGSTVNDAIKPQRKDKPPVRPSSAVRKSTNSSNNNTPPTGKSAPIAETPKRADRRVPAKKVMFSPITSPEKFQLLISNAFCRHQHHGQLHRKQMTRSKWFNR